MAKAKWSRAFNVPARGLQWQDAADSPELPGIRREPVQRFCLIPLHLLKPCKFLHPSP